MAVRFAKEKDLPRVNELRKQVNDLHAAGKPEFFRPGFSKELADLVFAIFDDPDKKIVVAEREGVVCGFAVLHRVIRPENPYMFERVCLDVDEFCVDAPYRRKGVGSELIAFIRAYAKENGFRRIELNMWEFNRDALAFYESAGFSTYRRYLELEP
ncbi:MAG: GNAT family N-acetyltransferase [Clostridia bacterium]|nr:GNAT family N-acetyltransferase [Clostridia bacterium]